MAWIDNARCDYRRTFRCQEMLRLLRLLDRLHRMLYQTVAVLWHYRTIYKEDMLSKMIQYSKIYVFSYPSVKFPLQLTAVSNNGMSNNSWIMTGAENWMSPQRLPSWGGKKSEKCYEEDMWKLKTKAYLKWMSFIFDRIKRIHKQNFQFCIVVWCRRWWRICGHWRRICVGLNALCITQFKFVHVFRRYLWDLCVCLGCFWNNCGTISKKNFEEEFKAKFNYVKEEE